MDGIVIINKPKHQTSHDIVRKAKKILNEKVGHTGTLDPNATGVLPLLIGKGTELSKYLINHDKTYEAILQLGEKRDTGDVEGKIIEQKNVTEKSLNTENINSVFKTLIGKQEQIPPIYSALKVNGKKLYEYARKGEEVALPKREVEIFNIEPLSKINNNTFTFKCTVSKGTYIRSLIRDIGVSLGTYATMSDLRRTKQGIFNIEDAYTLEDIENNNYKILDAKDVLKLPKVIVDKNLEFKVKNGQVLTKFFKEDKAQAMDFIESQEAKDHWNVDLGTQI